MREYSQPRRGESYEHYRERLLRGGEIEPGEALPAQVRAPSRRAAGTGAPRKRSGAPMVIVLLVILAAAGADAWALLGRGAPAHYRARVTDTRVIDPAHLDVTVRVTNTGQAAGTPVCLVSANDPSFSSTGTDDAQLNESIRPGATVTFVMELIVTNQGAASVTHAKASCS